MLVIFLLFTLCSADSDLHLEVHQLQLHSTVQGEDTWLYASESWYLAPVFLPLLPDVPWLHVMRSASEHDERLFFVLVGITAKGCFAFSSHALNSTTSMDMFSAALASNGFTIAMTPFDSSNCFKLDFVLPEPGEHQLEIGIAEVMNGSVTFIGNASTPVTVGVLQREGEQ